MRRRVVLLAPLAFVLSACPSLDGFVADGGGTGDVQDAGPTGQGYLSLSDAVKFCSKAISCPNLAKSAQVSLDIPVDNTNFAACVSWLTGTLPPERVGLAQARQALQCAVQATSCSAAVGCMWLEFIFSGTDPRCVGYDGGALGACSASLNAAYQCNYGFIAHCDNAFNFNGSQCLAGDQGYEFCAISSGLCSGAGAPPSCSGSFFQNCQQGLLTSYDCMVQGETCGLDPVTKEYACLSNGTHKTCTMAGTSVCTGDVVQLCDGLTTSEFDCASLGGTCNASHKVPECILPNAACSPYDGTSNVCTGDTVSLCIDGQPKSFDCTTAGLKCVTASSGVCQ